MEASADRTTVNFISTDILKDLKSKKSLTECGKSTLIYDKINCQNARNWSLDALCSKFTKSLFSSFRQVWYDVSLIQRRVYRERRTGWPFPECWWSKTRSKIQKTRKQRRTSNHREAAGERLAADGFLGRACFNGNDTILVIITCQFIRWGQRTGP